MKQYLLTMTFASLVMLSSAYGSEAKNLDLDTLKRVITIFQDNDIMTEDEIKNIFRTSADDVAESIARNGFSGSIVKDSKDMEVLNRFIAILKEDGVTEDQIKNALGKSFNEVIAPSKTVVVRVETMHRIASENAVCLKGCRILGEHVIDMAGSPDKLGKFIARAMLQRATYIHQSLYVPNIYSEERKFFQRIGNSLDQYHAQLHYNAHFDIDGFIGTVEELRDHHVNARARARSIIYTRPLTSSIPNLPNELIDYNLATSRLDDLLENAKTYKKALTSGSGFLLTATRRFGRFSSKGIAIRRLARAAVLPIVAVVAEFFFAEPMSAATLDDFDVEVSPEEYEVFYAAVEMERDRLLPYLENSDDPEDRDLAAEIRRTIEEE